MHVLVVEDTIDVGEGVVAAVSRMGHKVDWAHDGLVADEMLAAYAYDLVLLDLMLPRMDGVELLRRLRGRRHKAAVLVLTARSAVDERVQVLDLGADDYLCKPFEFAELEARVRSLLRRHAGEKSNLITVGDVTFDRNTRAVSIADELVSLSRRELSLLEMLIVGRGRILSKAHLLESLFDGDGDTSENAVEVLIGRVRRRLAGSSVEICNHRGLGYQIRAVGD